MLVKDVVYVYRLVGGEKLAWHGRYHAHGAGEYEFHFFVEGQGSFLSSRTRLRLEAGRLTLTRPREFHSILPEAIERPITYYAVLFEPEPDSRDDEAALALLEGGPPPRHLEARDRFLFEELHRLSRAEDEGGRRAASFQLLSLIHRWYGARAAGAAERGPRKDHTDRALVLMQGALRGKLGMEELAAKLDLSEEHFIRSFRAELGMTPFQYYTRLKIEAACGLLAGGRMAVGAIAEHFAFENQFHFTRVFKKCTGLSPSDYRRIYGSS